MVGVVVALMISTMHEKSCKNLHNALKFEKDPIFSHSQILQSQKQNCEININMDYLNHFNHMMHSINKLFFTLTDQNMSHMHIFAFTFCANLLTPELSWRHKGVAMQMTHKAMHRFSTMHGSPPLALELRYKFQLLNKSKPANSY